MARAPKLPQIDTDERFLAQVAWAYQFAMGALLHHLIDHRVERLSRGANTSHDPQAASLLIDFMAAGIAALLPIHPSP